MSPTSDDIQAIETSTLLTCYGFDLRGLTPLGLINDWLEVYPLQWIRWAVIEALYQGRYKAISVEQLLNFWLRRGQPSFHFNSDFERLISNNLPKTYSTDTLLNSEDEKRSLLVPPTMTVPNFPPPPSLLESILNKPLIKREETVESDPWEADLEDFSNGEEPLTLEEAREDFLEDEIVMFEESTEQGLSNHDDGLETLPVQANPQALTNDNLETETISEIEMYPSSRSIHRFIPVLDESDLFGKLRTVVHRELAGSLT